MDETKKLIAFDLDGTLTPFSTWKLFNERLGITQDQDEELFKKYLHENLEYSHWIKELVTIYTQNSAVSKSELEAFAETISLRPEAKEITEYVKSKGYHIVMISGAVDIVAKAKAAELGIGEWCATNKAVFDHEEKLVDIDTMGDERDAKYLLLETFCLKNGYTINEVISIGDGGNDVEIFKHTKGIMLGDNKELGGVAWKKINSLEELKDIL